MKSPCNILYHTIRWISLILITLLAVSSYGNDTVRMWEESLVLPTYQMGENEVNPIFRRPLSYQGASKVIYPYPLQDKLTNNREDQIYKALYLENKYIKLCILPELGGRLFYATDKTNDYEIFYRQHVIKPSQIGMLGAWISGGIEWCVFHHHRASTFLPVNYRLVSNDDGSKSIWIGEIEPRHRMKWSIGITLSPNSSLIKATIRMYNRTDYTHSILYWANVATHANDDYQIFFPPSTDFGVFHAKNEFVHWPIARTRYRGVDYRGVDLSWWKNHPKPVSIFAHDLKDGFLAGYDHGQEAGVVHVGNPHIVTGAKLWEWGPGEEGSMWDTKVLTDSDGPYAELMTGAYSDNQPDYSWIKPHETKEAIQHWYPLRDLGGVKAANTKAAINLEARENGNLKFGVNVTEPYPDARIILSANDTVLFEKQIDIDPAHPFIHTIEISDSLNKSNLECALYTKDNECLIRYQPVIKDVPDELPDTVQPPASPEKIETIEELYITGLRIKQFHNARLNPHDYFLEALQRDPSDSRCNIQMGLDATQRGLYDKAETYFQTAIDRLSKNYTRPRDCEAYYQLGLIQKRKDNPQAAYDNLYRAVWDFEFRAAAYFKLAEIACLQNNYDEALDHINNSLAVNALDPKALGLKSAILRHLDRHQEALRGVNQALKLDPLGFLAKHERIISLETLNRNKRLSKETASFIKLLKDDPESYLEMAADYINAGFWNEALNILNRAVDLQKDGLSDYPTIHYYLAYLYHQNGNKEKVETSLKTAQQCPTDYCFPFRLETIDILQFALDNNSHDGRAKYFMGNLLYDRQPEKAIEYWEQSVNAEPTLAIAHRNLGWGYYYALDDITKAIKSYQRAVQLNPTDARYYYELDRLHERNGTSIAQRLELLENNHQAIQTSEPALIREIMVLVQAGKYDKAIEYLNTYYFHIQEGNRRLHDTFVDAHLLRGLHRFHGGDYQKALDDFLIANTYPENHQVGRDPNYNRNAEIDCLIGFAYQALNKLEKANTHFRQAVEHSIHSYDDPTYLYYQGVAYRELGEEEKANHQFSQLEKAGKRILDRADQTDFFTKFGEGDPANVRKAIGHLAIGLSYEGRNKPKQAKASFKQAIQADINNLWAHYYLEYGSGRQ